MDYVLITAGLAIAVLAVAALALAHRRHDTAHDPATPLDQMLVRVDELGDWDRAALDELEADPDPLDTAEPLLAGEDLVPAYTFQDLMDLHPVRLDFPPISFETDWMAAGERLAQLGDTAVLEVVPA